MEERDHPNELELELARTGEASDDVVAHLAECDWCQRRNELLVTLAETLGPKAVIEIPEARDAAIRDLIASRAKPRRWRYWAPVAAAAATLAVALVPTLYDRPPAIAGDVNGDGVVSIVDAMLLQKTLEREGETAPHWDLNGDTRIDHDDVEGIAMASVTIGGTR